MSPEYVSTIRGWIEEIDAKIAHLHTDRQALEAALGNLDTAPQAAPQPAVSPRTPGRPPKAPGLPAERPASKSEQNGKKGRPSNKPDLKQLADEMVELRTAGVRSVAREISIKYKVPESTAKNWMAAARGIGLVPVQRANLKVLEDNTGPEGAERKFDAARLAECYLQEIRAGRRPVMAVMDEFNVPRRVALTWITRARAEGALPPAHEPQLPEEERRAILAEYKPEPVG